MILSMIIIIAGFGAITVAWLVSMELIWYSNKPLLFRVLAQPVICMLAIGLLKWWESYREVITYFILRWV